MLGSTPLPFSICPAALASELRPHLATVHSAVLECASGPQAARDILMCAPAEACQLLADMWADVGPFAPAVRTALTREEQLVLDMVIATYPPTQRPTANRLIS